MSAPGAPAAPLRRPWTMVEHALAAVGLSGRALVIFAPAFWPMPYAVYGGVCADAETANALKSTTAAAKAMPRPMNLRVIMQYSPLGNARGTVPPKKIPILPRYSLGDRHECLPPSPLSTKYQGRSARD